MKAGWVLAVGIGAVALVWLAPVVAAQTVVPVDRLVVVDSNGKKVGGIIGSFKTPDVAATDTVALDVDGHIFRMNVTRTRFVATTVAAVSFESSQHILLHRKILLT